MSHGSATWLVIDGTELINNARATTYLALAGYGSDCSPLSTCGTRQAVNTWMCPPCPGFTAWQGGGPYTSIPYDPAPWYDPAIPQSTRVYGYAGVDIMGISSSPIANSDGQVIRELEINTLVYAADEAAMSYAISWLAQAVGGSPCRGGTCAGSTVCLLAHCPSAHAADPLRQVLDVTVLEGPEIVEWIRHTGTPLVTRVTYTLQASVSGLWAPPLPGASLTVIPALGASKRIDLPAVYEQCVAATPCAADPECDRPVMPELPAAPIDACYPSKPYAGRQTIGLIPPGAIPNSLITAPLITASAGSKEMHNLTVRFWVNALGTSCTDIAASVPCAACADITVGYVPAGGNLIIDGRTRRSVIECVSPGGVDTATPVLYGPLGSSYTWPEFSCGFGLCVEIIAEADVAADATVTVEFPYQAGAI